MNPPINPALGEGNRITIVHPREPMPGALAVTVQENRLDEMGALERERARRIWRVRGIISGHYSSGLERRRERRDAAAGSAVNSPNLILQMRSLDSA
jgi:hypothetical protein